MTDSPASTGVIVPAMYIGQSDYVLTVSDDLAESFAITASQNGEPIITGHDFRPPASGSFDPRDDPGRLASTFGSFLASAIEGSDYVRRYPEYADDYDSFDGWAIHDSDFDLYSLADACALYGEDDSSC